ncbi:MAG: class II aldolase/adducin family protein [Spirochaetia bacterium]|nr:class II aldolase/adducin family protein [Spirochaetia bacterium]
MVADYMVRLYDRHLTTASGGNISLRLNSDYFCITPSALDKGNLEKDQIAIVKFDGTNMTPDLKLSIETGMHRMILLARPDMQAIVHAHPVYACAFASSMETELTSKYTAEAYWVIRDIVNVPYQLMGSKELAVAVSQEAKKHTVMLMQNHGAIAAGTSLLNAFDKMELLERAAQMQIICQSIPGSRTLTEAQCEVLRNWP